MDMRARFRLILVERVVAAAHGLGEGRVHSGASSGNASKGIGTSRVRLGTMGRGMHPDPGNDLRDRYLGTPYCRTYVRNR